jgi:hypothetical protein
MGLKTCSPYLRIVITQPVYYSDYLVSMVKIFTQNSQSIKN